MSWREGRLIGHAEFEPFGGGLLPGSPLQADGMDDPLVRRAIEQNPELDSFLRWAVLPIADVERGRCRAKVAIGDARYSFGSRRSRLGREVIVPLDGPGC